MVSGARARGGAGSARSATGGAPAGPEAPTGLDARSPGPAPSSAGSSSAVPSTEAAASQRDERSPSRVTLRVVDADAHRGAPLHVQGDVRADGDPCAHVVVEIWLKGAPCAGRDCRGEREGVAPRSVLLGTVATGDEGRFVGAIVVPSAAALGDYDVVAQTPGDARCGRGASP
jgi:protocatechuate 3,4-dioxygenase beta subunit